MIFTKRLDDNDNDIDVKVSSLNSPTQFLSGINEDIISNFTVLSDKMLQTLIDALKYENEQNNDKGKTGMETMNTISTS